MQQTEIQRDVLNDKPNLEESHIDYSIEYSDSNSQMLETSVDIQLSQYEKVRLIGHGSFGKVNYNQNQVYLVKNLATQENFVMKQMSTFDKNDQEVQGMLKESVILQSLNHLNIIKFQESFIDKKQKLNIIMEYAEGCTKIIKIAGDLSQYLKARQGQLLTEVKILELSSQLISAMCYLQQKKILHRDLKCENLFMMDQKTIKLGDFGISKVFLKAQDQAKTFVGTPYYLSPEILQGKAYQYKSDLWSLGVIIYELCTLKKPFEAESLHFLTLKILRGRYKPLNQTQYSINLRNLVQNLLQVDPAKRPTIDQVQSLPLFIGSKPKTNVIKAKQPQNGQKVSVQPTQFQQKIKPNPQKLVSNKLQEDKIKLESKNNLVDPKQENLLKKNLRDNQRQNMCVDIQQKKKDLKNSPQSDELLIENFGQLQINDQQIRQLNQFEEQSLQYIVTESTKLEELRQLLEDQMGMDDFVAAYKTVSATIEVLDLEEIEQKYGENNYVDLLPFMQKQNIDKYLPLLFTLIFLEQDLQK